MLEENLKKREKWNLTMFIISYILNNLVSGVLYDTYVNYLQEVSLSIATSFWAFYGYATFISAAVLLLVAAYLFVEFSAVYYRCKLEKQM